MLVKNQVDAFSSAASLLTALRHREIGSRELLEALIRRVERFDGVLNSIVFKDFERARFAATAADQRRRDADDSPLLGLPITIKESLDVQGLPSTAGVPFRKGHVAPKDSRTVARLRAAGAVILGKTNVCTWLADFQSDNPVYGRTNNPWNLARTPGGSSGGSATLAAGLTALDIGTDLAGSIRVPAAFCGLWGHKPSESVVPNSGHFPGSDLPNPLALLAVQGPHARSATDLELSLKLMAGPDVGMDKAWSLSLSPARHESIADFRVAILPPQPWLPVVAEILEAQERLIHELTSAGAAVKELSPPGFEDLRAHYSLFRSMMSALVSVHWPDDLRQWSIADKLARNEEFHAADAHGFAATAPRLFHWHSQREIYRAAWRDFFRDYDVLITPITPTPAFEHTTIPNADRRLQVNGSSVEFEYMSFYPSLASLAGQPATVIPAGLTESGLPIGLQIIGPYLEDRTNLKFAQLLESLIGSFSPPPGYSGELM